MWPETTAVRLCDTSLMARHRRPRTEDSEATWSAEEQQEIVEPARGPGRGDLRTPTPQITPTPPTRRSGIRSRPSAAQARAAARVVGHRSGRCGRSSHDPRLCGASRGPRARPGPGARRGPRDARHQDHESEPRRTRDRDLRTGRSLPGRDRRCQRPGTRAIGRSGRQARRGVAGVRGHWRVSTSSRPAAAERKGLACCGGRPHRERRTGPQQPERGAPRHAAARDCRSAGHDAARDCRSSRGRSAKRSRRCGRPSGKGGY